MKFLTSSAIASFSIVAASVALLSCSEAAEPAETATPAAQPVAAAAPVGQASAVPAAAVNPPHGQPGHVHDDPLPGAGISAPPVQRTGNPQEQIGINPNSWFEATELDMGSYYLRETAHGDFRFKNPSQETRRFTALRQSCNCTKSTFLVGDREYYMADAPDQQDVLYEVKKINGARVPERVDAVVVGPGEEGVVKVDMKMNGTRGSRHASIGFTIDDPDLQGVTLAFHALGTVYFTVTPEEVNLNTMRWDETRTFEIQVTSPVMGDFDIVRHEALPPGMQINYEKTLINGQALYTIKGTYGPLQDGASNGGTLVFHTDKNELSFDVRVLAMIEGPLTMNPGFLALSMIPKGTSASKTATISAGESFDLQVTSLEPKELSFDAQYLNASWEKNEAGDVVVKVEVLPGLEARTLIRGELIVHLNHPAAESKSILFNGFVR